MKRLYASAATSKDTLRPYCCRVIAMSVIPKPGPPVAGRPERYVARRRPRWLTSATGHGPVEGARAAGSTVALTDGGTRRGFTEAIELAVKGFETAGVAAMVVGALLATAAAARTVRSDRQGTYSRFRQQLGRSILLGLELLVAADIIRTVAITPTLNSVLVLGLIVLIRTFLSFSLELEITGRWPWQSAPATSRRARSIDALPAAGANRGWKVPTRAQTVEWALPAELRRGPLTSSAPFPPRSPAAPSRRVRTSDKAPPGTLTSSAHFHPCSAGTPDRRVSTSPPDPPDPSVKMGDLPPELARRSASAELARARRRGSRRTECPLDVLASRQTHRRALSSQRIRPI